MQLRLQSKILAGFLLLMVVLQVGGVALINALGMTAARKSIGEDLESGSVILNQLFNQNSHRAVQAARLIASDYTLRKAIVTGDQATIASALDKHRRGIDASSLMIIGLDQRVLGNTLEIATGKPFAFPSLIAEAGASQTGSAMVVIRGHLYQLVVTSVLAPRPIAWIALGSLVNDTLAQNLKRLTRLDVSFLSRQGSDSWRLKASTLSEKDRTVVQSNLTTGRFAGSDGDGKAEYKDETATRVIALATSGDERVVGVPQWPLSLAFEPFRRLQRLLTFISLVGLLVTIIAGVAVARGLARPMRDLASVARHIAAGDYSTTSPSSNVVEIADVTAAFRATQERIAGRESQLLALAHRDALTQLPNRALYNDRLDQAITSAQRGDTQVAVLLMDLDC
jgi:HAMP domain-containing protein